MFKVTIGKKGLSETWQKDFPETTKCKHCKGEARIGFVVFENFEKGKTPKEQDFVCRLHPNKPETEGYWLHDCCAVAVYFCKKCFKITALWNQA